MKRTERASRRGRGDMVVRRWLTLLLSLALLFMPFAGRGAEQQKIEYWLK